MGPQAEVEQVENENELETYKQHNTDAETIQHAAVSSSRGGIN